MTTTRPNQKIMTIAGWTISADSRQYITSDGGQQFYFSSLEGALADIADLADKTALTKVQPDLHSVVETLRQSRSEFLNDIKNAITLEIK